MTNIDKLERDFELFGKGINRLENLKKELNSLNTKGFEKDKHKIESELKNVTDIPKIEKQMNTLKKKISGTHSPKKKTIRKIIKKKTSKPKINLDQDVAKLVKVQMDTIALDIKKSLSERVRLKETRLQEKIKHQYFIYFKLVTN